MPSPVQCTQPFEPHSCAYPVTLLSCMLPLPPNAVACATHPNLLKPTPSTRPRHTPSPAAVATQLCRRCRAPNPLKPHPPTAPVTPLPCCSRHPTLSPVQHTLPSTLRHYQSHCSAVPACLSVSPLMPHAHLCMVATQESGPLADWDAAVGIHLGR